jgi:hypothetical protein
MGGLERSICNGRRKKKLERRRLINVGKCMCFKEGNI